MESVKEFQDLGDIYPKVRRENDVGLTGVLQLYPDKDGSHIDAVEEIREVIDKHYGDHIQSVADENEKVLIERAVFPSDDLPQIEYRLLESLDE